jgi:hypothetical protein
VRKLVISVTGVVLLGAVVAGVSLAAGGARLNGKFDVSSVIGQNDIGVPQGQKNPDTYTFKAGCKKGTCKSVTLTRASGTRNIKSTLTRNKKGVYVGTEGPVPYTCVKPIGNPGTFTGDHTIKITKSKKGKATKISGTGAIHIKGCTETIEKFTLTGTLK